MNRLSAMCAVVALSLSPLAPAAAQSSGMDMKDMGMKMDNKPASKGPTHRATGTVKSVDAAKGTVTIDHQAINSINWPAMTMTFKARDKAMLKNIRPGEKVDFSLVQSGKDQYAVTQIKPRK